MKANRIVLLAGVGLLATYALIRYQQPSSSQPLPVKAEREHEERGERENRSKAYMEAREQYELVMLRDPATGVIPKGIFEKEAAFARTIPVKQNPFFPLTPNGGNGIDVMNSYIPAGPNNIGGRTRALAYDVRFDGTSNRVIIAGCVSGGIMRSADGGQTWVMVTPQNDIHSFTAIVQDPRAGSQNTWYAAGGEFSGNTASSIGAPYLGYGIWKSVDNGVNWVKLPLTINDPISGFGSNPGALHQFDHPFDFIYRMVVSPVNGDLYVAAFRRLVRSTDGGATWNAVFGSNGATNANHGQMDVAITNAGRVYVAVNGGNPDQALRGLWFSSTGNLNSFTRIAGGQTLGVDSVDGWRANSPTTAGRRILIELAPSNQNIGYVYYENGLSSDPPQLQPEGDLFRMQSSGTSFTWSNRSANMPDIPGGNLSGSDPLALQGGYNMLVRVKPDDPNTVFIGGTNLYRSTDGFATSSNTAWIGGYNTNFTYQQYPNSHADMHELRFNPSNPNQAACGNDGGVQFTSNILAPTVAWMMPGNYQTLQCYYVAVDPDAGRNNFASGSQDNGVRLRDKMGILGTSPADSNNHLLIFSADGAGVGISRLDQATQNQYLYGGYQLGNIFRYRMTNGPQLINIRPNGLTTNPSYGSGFFGEFVTNFRLHPDNTEDLYYVNFNRLFRTITASSVAAGGWTELTGVSNSIGTGASTGANSIRGMAFTRGNYNTSHALYLGTTNGRIYRLDDPRNATAGAAPLDITPSSALVGNVQDIAVNPNNDNEVMAVVSNYTISGGNAVNIWWCNNAKSATPIWYQAEGNLGTGFISARSCAIVVSRDANNNPVTDYYVGTGAGLYSVSNMGATLLAGGSPTWQREGAAILNLAVIQHMAYRPADNLLLVGTHGNGMYYAYTGTPNFNPNQNTSTGPVVNDRNFIRSAYPTLTNGRISYQIGNMTGVRKIQVQLTDLTGRTVYLRELGYSNGFVDLQGTAAGTYILTITSDDRKNRFVQKVVRQ
jgi:hypothetical protein